MNLKHIPVQGEELKLSILEAQWQLLLRKRREADERKKKREKEQRIKDDMLKLSAGMMNKGTDAEKAAARVKARLLRPKQEVKDIRDEYERTVGDKLREDAATLVEKLRKDAEKDKPLTRSEVMALTRGIQFKLQMDERIRKRNLVRDELNERRRIAEEVRRLSATFSCHTTQSYTIQCLIIQCLIIQWYTIQCYTIHCLAIHTTPHNAISYNV